MLREQEYIDIVKNIVKNIEDNVHIENKNTLWEYTKCQIRTDTIAYSAKRAKELREREEFLRKRVETLEKDLKDNEINYVEYIQCKTEWENIIRVKTEGILLRSKSKWVEEGERNSKYFLNLEKRNYNTNYIKTLITKENKHIDNLNDIICEQRNFYESLYSTKTGNNSIDIEASIKFTEQDNIPKLDEESKSLCESEITMEECALALKNLANNKSPGSDGFTTNFYKFFWSDIKSLLFDSFKYSYNNMCLSQNQKLSILNLLPKKEKDLRYLANWRPVSLLNTDYKILTKVLAIRLQKVIYKLINSDQVGYVKGRFIGENIRTMFDIMNYIDNSKESGFFVQVDFEKAFDSIEWSFLIKGLKSYNFGSYFINWIKILYTDISSCVGNNGYYSEYFTLSRSIRQGCPVSALLFILIAELIAINIRNDKKIKGININGIEYKISLMADDTTLFMMDLESLKIAIEKFHNFEKCSGLKLNLCKTEIIPLGKNRNSTLCLPKCLTEIKINNGPFKALGIWFAKTELQVSNLNFNNRLKKIESMLTLWRLRNLSIKGKICILKTLILPQVKFLFNMIYVPYEVLERIDKMFFQFLWDKKPAKIKRKTIIAAVSDGGMGMIDIFDVHVTAKVGWIIRFFNQANSKWKNLFKIMINIDETKLNKNMDFTNNGKTRFHMQLLKCWFNIINITPTNVKDICNQYLLYNQNILVNRKVLTDNTRMIGMNRDTKLIDLLDCNGKFLEFNILKQKFKQLSVLGYNSLITSIPSHWKHALQANITKMSFNDLKQGLEPYIKIGNVQKSLNSKITCKQIYHSLIDKNIQPPTAIETWVEMYPFLESQNWTQIYRLPFQITKEPYMQSFQYKILNRIINTREKLCQWKIINNNKCLYCGVVDTIEHHFINCHNSKEIWDRVRRWIKNNLNTYFRLSECEIIFGLTANDTDDMRAINFIILLTKWYINKQRSQNLEMYFFEVLQLIRSKIDSMSYNRLYKGETPITWQHNLMVIL